MLRKRKTGLIVSSSEFPESDLLIMLVVTIAYDTLSNSEKKKQYDKERLNAVTLAMIRREFSAPNKSYYKLFQLTPPGQEWAPLSTEDINKLRETATNYLNVVVERKVSDEEKLVECKFVPPPTV